MRFQNDIIITKPYWNIRHQTNKTVLTYRINSLEIWKFDLDIFAVATLLKAVAGIRRWIRPFKHRAKVSEKSVIHISLEHRCARLGNPARILENPKLDTFLFAMRLTGFTRTRYSNGSPLAHSTTDQDCQKGTSISPLISAIPGRIIRLEFWETFAFSILLMGLARTRYINWLVHPWIIKPSIKTIPHVSPESLVRRFLCPR